MKACDVYFRGDTVFVFAMAKTVPGFLIRLGPMFKYKRDEAPSASGEGVLQALAAFRENISMEQAPRGPSPEFFEFVGVKSWNTFMRNALNLSIAFDGRTVSVTPTVRAHGGFDHLPDQDVICPPEPQAIGEALLKAVALSS